MLFASTSIVLLLAARTVVAFPSIPGSCESGPSPVGGPHVGRTPSGNGTLFDGGYEVTIDGMTLDQDVAFGIETGTSYTVVLKTIDNDTNFFRGFLIRLSSESGTDATSFLTSVEADVQSNIGICQPSLAGSLAHVASNDKTSISGSLTVPPAEPSEDWSLEVTVVKFNNGADGSFWYKTDFSLQVGSGSGGVSPATEQPTMAPTGSPTETPATEPPTTAPTDSPTEKPTNEPTIAPTGSPTETPATEPPTTAPTDSPTETPTTEPTIAPTGSPSETPATATPTTAPTDSPTETEATETPTKAPTDRPTIAPTDSPVTAPTTEQPTIAPTVSPIATPATNQPTISPTDSPIDSPSQSTPVPTVVGSSVAVTGQPSTLESKKPEPSTLAPLTPLPTVTTEGNRFVGAPTPSPTYRRGKKGKKGFSSDDEDGDFDFPILCQFIRCTRYRKNWVWRRLSRDEEEDQIGEPVDMESSERTKRASQRRLRRRRGL